MGGVLDVRHLEVTSGASFDNAYGTVHINGHLSLPGNSLTVSGLSSSQEEVWEFRDWSTVSEDTLNVNDYGSVEFQGGSHATFDDLTISSGGLVELSGGQLELERLDIQNGGSFDFTDGALRTIQFVGDLAQDGGLITIGNSPGMMDIDGNYLMNAGTLEIELGGYVAGTEFDFLDVSGTAMLDGQLDVLLIDGFLPETPGDSFTILQADGGITLGSGFAASLPDLSHLGPHSAWQVNVSGNSLALSVVPEPSSMTFAGMVGCFGVAVATRRRRNSCQTSA